MKYILPIFLFALIAPFLFEQFKPSQPLSPAKQIEKNQPTKSSLKQIEIGKKIIQYDIFLTSVDANMRIVSNLEVKVSSQDFLNQNQCRYLINGGFYTKEFKNIGLLSIDDQNISNKQQNKLFNGLISASESGRVAIGQTHEFNDVENGLQTGPILIQNGKNIELSIQNDESERRMILGTTSNGQTIGMVVENITLEELPMILTHIATKENLVISHAINLDGGTASVFKNEQTYIREIKPVGTYLCFE